MKISECSHIRLRNGNCNDYGMNVEWIVKHVEDVYQIDFRSLPHWEQLIQRMQHANTYCKQAIQNSQRRKAAIIHKLLIQSFRLSPFELTDNMVRTAKKWQIIEVNLKMKKKSTISLSKSIHSSSHENETYDKYGEIMGEESPGRPNTEVIDFDEPVVKKEELIEVTIADSLGLGRSILPANISTNQHKYISLSNISDIFLKAAESESKTMNIKGEEPPEEWLILSQNTNIRSVPSTINIQNICQDQQIIPFSLVNCATTYLNLLYKGVTDVTAFRYAKVIPARPVKLFPGVPVNFKFVFKLKSDQNDFTCHLHFRVGQKVYAKAPIERFGLPITLFNFKSSTVHVTEVVNIPPMYFWRINAKSRFPFSDLTIRITDGKCYDLQITKLKVNLAQVSEENLYSNKPTSPTSDTIAQREEDNEVIAESQTLVSTSELPEETESVLMENFIILILDEAIEVALDVFVFEKRFLRLEPYSKQSVKVFHTKAEHIGCHQNLYELAFTNPLTDEFVFSKTIKVFGEVLPNPVQMYPSFLDMTESPIVNGRCEDHFTIVNSHRGLPVAIKIKLTTKMKKMIRINPMETHISTRSSVDICVSFCSKDLNQSNREDFVHLTFKIIVIGDNSVYRDLPPIFYEMLVPCTSEFKKLYNEKFFNEFCDAFCEAETESNLPTTPTSPTLPSTKPVKRDK